MAERELASPRAKPTARTLDQADARAVDERELPELERDLLVPCRHRRRERARKPRSAGEVELAPKDEHDRVRADSDLDPEALSPIRERSSRPL